MKERSIMKMVLLVICISLAASVPIQVASAGIPNIVSVTVWTSGTHTMLNITVTHSPPPSIGPGHYVSIVRLDINGTTNDVTQSPQSTTTFAVTYDMGEVAGAPTVRAQAFCNVHGWSVWSDTITVPEYSTITLLLVLVAVSIIIIIMRRDSRSRGEFHRNRSVYCSK